MPSYRLAHDVQNHYDAAGTLTNWPPSSTANAGVGMCFNLNNAAAFASKGIWQLTPGQLMGGVGVHWGGTTADNLPSVRSSIVLAPGKTIAFTERPNRNGNGYQGDWVGWIDNPWWSPNFGYWQLGDLDGEPESSYRPKYHNSRFNYAFVDGHVELLDPGETSNMKAHSGTPTPQSGMWTIRADD